mmetsp:Transcript_19627/g.27036  ORF Transcript_19627/g.27036 Transcript_19627/m.27036 type:complete len:420 (+) Transcript_19627:289-1548(+)|eukprot:CAMPEP_0201477144 /NCGR_PEP_ID=MMETSP0151_2-20130828/2227_1 /ASSEMBLY_ACC=CAM_ASM_000257 /TAXON_ID=200890 /ORGANISM="Paramoeba atlantica, Strain 621/1 / CCAP 1560/9" /LENGTH=419 /DNA_ID=CAMNT_0047857767 /DNA_START=879 /DNA_END=2138 /DNA_ORIENTATION=-
MDKRAFYVINTAGKKVDGKKVNINGGDDLFYRYKMSQLQIQIVGKGKMIKTMLLNNEDVANDLHLMPQYIPAYLGYEIGAQFKYEVKKPERERAHISGEYTSLEISDVIEKMIKEVVLCPGCNLPELKMTCDPKKRKIFVKCASCGRAGEFKKCNMKFHKFILNNPPKNVGGVDNKKLKQVQVKKEKTEKTEKSDEKSDDSAEGSGDGSDTKEDQQQEDADFDEEEIKLTDAELQRAKEQGVQWKADTSKEAMESRRTELVPDAIKQLVVAGVDTSGSEKLKNLLAKNPPDNEVCQLLASLKKQNSIDDDEAVEIVFSYLYGEGELLKATKAHKVLLRSVLTSGTTQVAFLLQLENLLATKGAAFIKKSPAYFKTFYDLELVEEQSILKWFSLESEDQRVRAKTQPFITWLEEAEEESD